MKRTRSKKFRDTVPLIEILQVFTLSRFALFKIFDIHDITLSLLYVIYFLPTGKRIQVLSLIASV